MLGIRREFFVIIIILNCFRDNIWVGGKKSKEVSRKIIIFRCECKFGKI